MIKKIMQNPLISFLGFAFGLSLVSFLFYYLNISIKDIKPMFTHKLFPEIILLPLFFTVLLMVTGAWKWAIITKDFATENKTQKKFAFFLRHYIWQNWIGLFVPASISIIVGRAIAEKNSKFGAFSAFFDQFLELFFLVALIPFSILFLLKNIGTSEFVFWSILSQFFAGILLWFIFNFFIISLKRCSISVLLLSSFRVFLIVARISFGAIILNLNIDFWNIASSAPIVSLLSLIPITPANLGLAEWGWAGILSLVGENIIYAGLFAIGFRLVIMIVQTIILLFSETYFYLNKKLKSNIKKTH